MKWTKGSVLLAICGLLLIFAAIRDALWPGFFVMAKHHASTSDYVLEVGGGALFLFAAWRKALKSGKEPATAQR